MKIQYAGCTDIGKIKKRNEDSMYIPQDGVVKDVVIVADGMGGYQAGDVASSMAVQVILNMVGSARKKRLPEEASARMAIAEANRSILDYASQNEFFSGMGTTVVLGIRRGKHWIIAHVGDSRAYLIHDGQIRQITHDHSLVQAMIDNGKLTYEEARVHPYRNIIMRAVGTEAEVESDISEVEYDKGDILLLCSDGLIRHVEDDELLQMALQKDSLEHITQQMVDMANERGGQDNITVLMARCEGR
ncbi:MAG: Stp1/IreP family PP2C-type Ser/Thr phosphatase [Eubacteriales bacterium]|nr:Stp1/IreP family PP2C-type Ser/Thr phosphatase [Eubacteriales bacterium]